MILCEDFPFENKTDFERPDRERKENWKCKAKQKYIRRIEKKYFFVSSFTFENNPTKTTRIPQNIPNS